jgi:hypothetical protein
MTSPSEIQILVIKQWVELAREDLAWAEKGAEDISLPGPGKIGFHAQQAVEKLLKGLLTSYGVALRALQVARDACATLEGAIEKRLVRLQPDPT